MDKKKLEQLEILIEDGEKVLETKQKKDTKNMRPGPTYVKSIDYYSWTTQSLQFLEYYLGEDNLSTIQLNQLMENSTYGNAVKALGILKGIAKGYQENTIFFYHDL